MFKNWKLHHYLGVFAAVVVLVVAAVFAGAQLFGRPAPAAAPAFDPAGCDRFSSTTDYPLDEPASRAAGDCVWTEPTVVLMAMPTSTPTPAGTSTPVLPTATPAASTATSSVSAPVASGTCSKHGTVAWQNDNQLSGAVYGEAPVGGLAEPCGIVAQTWTDRNGTERFFFYVPPYSVAWISGHRGGTGWYFDPSQNVLENLQRQAQEIEQRDGPMQTTIAILPNQTFRLVVRFKSVSGVLPTVVPVAVTGSCSGNTGNGPAIMEGDVGGKPTVVKVNAGQTYTLSVPGGCFPFPSQAALDARWNDHRAEFLRKYPAGQAIEKWAA